MVRFCLQRPALVGAAVFFLIACGLYALYAIPIQLTPDVERPRLTVRTYWPGASPYEVEREIITPQEKRLKKLDGLLNMESRAAFGRADVTLEFKIGSTLPEHLIYVINQLDQVTNFPLTAMAPRVILSGQSASPIAWAQVYALAGNANSIRSYKHFVEESIIPKIENIQGVAEMRVYGGRDPQIHVRFQPEKLALHRMSLSEIIQRIRTENKDVSAGKIEQGKRVYTVRTVNRPTKAVDLAQIILRANPSSVVRLGDVAEVSVGLGSEGSTTLTPNGAAMNTPIYKQAGSNVLQISQELHAKINTLNQGILKHEGLRMRVVSDPSYYINTAISLVTQNLYLGGFLAVVALALFLGSWRTSLVVACAIPISVLGALMGMWISGRNINVISLAGLAFAVGMVVDAAIVAAESLDTARHPKTGKLSIVDSAKAIGQVQGAIIASTLTTVAVFLPVVFVQDVAGQLFRDIALAIVFAIIFSMLVSLLVIPTLYRIMVLGRGNYAAQDPPRHGLAGAWVRVQNALHTGHLRHLQRSGAYTWANVCYGVLHQRFIQVFQNIRSRGAALGVGILRQVDWLLTSVPRMTMMCLGISLASIFLAWFLAPKLEYLPKGNRNFLLSLLFPPVGYNEKSLETLGRQAMESLTPYVGPEHTKTPRIEHTFFLSFTSATLMGVVAHNPAQASQLIPVMNNVANNLPGVRGFTTQTSLFARGLAAGRSIDLNIYGNRIADLAQVAKDLDTLIPEVMPGAQVRPLPSYDFAQPEVRVIPNPERAALAGFSAQDLGLILDLYSGGRKVDEFHQEDGSAMDIMLNPSYGALESVEDLKTRLILSPKGQWLPIAAVAKVQEAVGPSQIRHINGRRAFTLRVQPPPNLALEEALDTLEQKVIAPASTKDTLRKGVGFGLSGSADAFTKTRKSLQSGLLLALMITIILLVVVFEDLRSPLIILACLPIAAAGGVFMLRCVNWFLVKQPLDMLTMLGFLMMVGIVVNNPILIVSRALKLVRENGMAAQLAVRQSVQTRLRPIFMTTCTSVLGLSPLVLLPGAGSELYRGLGSAVLGGLFFSTIASVYFTPCMFTLLMPKRQNIA